MSNMSYCRFENTNSDLGDCAEHILDHLDTKYEGPARVSLVETCKDILEALGFVVQDADGNDVCRGQIEDAIEEHASNGSEEDDSEQYPHDEEDGITSDHLDAGAFESNNATKKED